MGACRAENLCIWLRFKHSIIRDTSNRPKESIIYTFSFHEAVHSCFLKSMLSSGVKNSIANKFEHTYLVSKLRNSVIYCICLFLWVLLPSWVTSLNSRVWSSTYNNYSILLYTYRVTILYQMKTVYSRVRIHVLIIKYLLIR